MYNYVCRNRECTEFEIKYLLLQFRKDEVKTCNVCHSDLEKLFPTKVTIKSSTEVNNQPLGKVIEEKNNKLKEKWGAYSHQQKSLQESIAKMSEEREGKRNVE